MAILDSRKPGGRTQNLAGTPDIEPIFPLLKVQTE